MTAPAGERLDRNRGAPPALLSDLVSLEAALKGARLLDGSEVTQVSLKEALVELEIEGDQVLIVDARRTLEGTVQEGGMREQLQRLLQRLAATSQAAILVIGDPGTISPPVDNQSGGAVGVVAALTWPVDLNVLLLTVRNLVAQLRLERDVAEGRKLAGRYRYELSELFEIGRAMSATRDINRLLHIILEKSRYITAADAGSVFVVEGDPDNPRERYLRFKASQNDSVNFDPGEFTLPIDERSVVGSCVVHRKVINLGDLREAGAEDVPGGDDASIGQTAAASDAKVGYRTISLLAVPMFDRAGDVIGVVELINKKREPKRRLHTERDFETQVVPFDARSEELAATLASQAGVSVENAILYDEIKRLFEGFVHASVTAIESRDPTTSGHSQRVAILSVSLAEKLELSEGTYRGTRFSRQDLKELEYASLLHDFGKVGVREHVLVKAKKLYEPQRELVLARFDYIRRSLEAELLQHKLCACLEKGTPGSEVDRAALDTQYQARIAELDDFVGFVLRANEPTVLESGGFERLYEIAQRTYVDGRGEHKNYLNQEETTCLAIPRGSLTARERVEIESHVVHTYNFLRKIPWGRTLHNVPAIAGSHHERMDGSGYPNRTVGQSIPLGARIMAITDIYDALTAKDRPYKKAVPLETALAILEGERKRNGIDADLLKVFVDAKVYEVTNSLTGEGSEAL